MRVALHERAMDPAGVGRVAQDLVDLLVLRLGPAGLAHMHRAPVAALHLLIVTSPADCTSVASAGLNWRSRRRDTTTQ